MKSLQMEQKVGWRKNVAINLWPLTWCIRRLHALRLLRIASFFSLNSFSFTTPTHDQYTTQVPLSHPSLYSCLLNTAMTITFQRPSVTISDVKS